MIAGMRAVQAVSIEQALGAMFGMVLLVCQSRAGQYYCFLWQCFV
jgi:hypothetical protein